MLNGSCLCEGIKYNVDCDPQPIVHCHCQTCRKAHGTAFSSIMAVPRESFSFVEGEEQLQKFESSSGKFRYFCNECGSQVIAERIDTPTIMLRVGCLDTIVDTKPIAHIWRSDSASWYDPKDQCAEFAEGFT